MDFGERLRICRDKRGLQQKYVAEKIGIKPNTLSMYEAGTREPSNDILVQLADIYEVTTDYLLGRSSNPKLTKKQEEQIDAETREWLEIVRQLNPENQEFFKRTMQAFIATRPDTEKK